MRRSRGRSRHRPLAPSWEFHKSAASTIGTNGAPHRQTDLESNRDMSSAWSEAPAARRLVQLAAVCSALAAVTNVRYEPATGVANAEGPRRDGFRPLPRGPDGLFKRDNLRQVQERQR